MFFQSGCCWGERYVSKQNDDCCNLCPLVRCAWCADRNGAPLSGSGVRNDAAPAGAREVICLLTNDIGVAGKGYLLSQA